jgi:adenylate cyclase
VTRAVGQFQMKGFDKPVEVFELLDWPERLDAAQPWLKTFAEALNNYYQRNLEFAAVGFRRTLELRPDDGPSKFYLQRIEELTLQPLSEGWTRYTQLKEK